MKRRQQVIGVVVIFVFGFLVVKLFTASAPAIVIAFEDDEIVLKKIGIVARQQAFLGVCEGQTLLANVTMPSGVATLCQEKCVQPIGTLRIYCDALKQEDGEYLIALSMFDSAEAYSANITSKEKILRGYWSE